MYNLSYSPLEKIPVKKPVDRIGYIIKNCEGKNVLDLGCYDETALTKQSTGYWLFEEISKVSRILIGIDNSSKIREEGIVLSEQVKILRGNVINFRYIELSAYSFDILVAGELIEHLTDTTSFLGLMKHEFNGKKLICTTPNSTSVSNVLLSLFKRESTHEDHKQIYSFKTLNTLCRIVGFRDWKITPYYVRYTEMILNAGPVKKIFVRFAESAINFIEYLFPMLSGGFILEIDL
jgi:hypothetical protein